MICEEEMEESKCRLCKYLTTLPQGCWVCSEYDQFEMIDIKEYEKLLEEARKIYNSNM